MEVADIYLDLYWYMFPVKPSPDQLAAKAMVSPACAEKVIQKLADTGNVINPELLKLDWKKAKGVGSCQTTEDEFFLLSLC